MGETEGDAEHRTPGAEFMLGTNYAMSLGFTTGTLSFLLFGLFIYTVEHFLFAEVLRRPSLRHATIARVDQSHQGPQSELLH